jgi:hypothetical protein
LEVHALRKWWLKVGIVAVVAVVVFLCIAVVFPVPIPHPRGAITPDQIVSLILYEINGLRNSAIPESALAQHASFRVDPKDIRRMFARAKYRWSPAILWVGSYLCTAETKDGRKCRIILDQHVAQFQVKGQDGFYVLDRASAVACAEVVKRAEKEVFAPMRSKDGKVGSD